jgi:hypothetical protein
MSTTFTWQISQLERELADGYVFNVFYTVYAENANLRAYVDSSLTLERPDVDLIPFPDLTEHIIVDWIKTKLGEGVIESIYNTLQAQLDEQRQPIKAGGLPWS